MTERNILETLETHRSIRQFKPEPIPAEDVATLMRLTQRASSGGNAQLYSVIRVTDAALRQRISELTEQETVVRAAEYFIFCMDVHRMRRVMAHRGSDLVMGPLISLVYGTIDCGLTSSHMAAAAEAMGYGICYGAGVQRVMEKLVEELELPEGVLPVVSLCVGVPDEEGSLRPRLPNDLIFHENSYKEPTPEDLERCYEAMSAFTFLGSWSKYLDAYYTAGKEYSGRDELWRQALTKQGFQMDGVAGA